MARQSMTSVLIVLMASAAPRLLGQEAPQPPVSQPARGLTDLNFEAPETEIEMKPTEVGVRFTPGIAKAIARQMSRDMKGRYDLSDDQVTEAQEILTRNMMKLAQSQQKAGRDAWELFMENVIANDGAFAKADGQRFAKLMNQMMPELKGFMITSASQIGKTMTLTQRLKLTGEMAALSAGFVGFEERMKKWEKGEVP